MSSVQLLLLQCIKLESSDYIVHWSTNSSDGEPSNILFPTQLHIPQSMIPNAMNHLNLFVLQLVFLVNQAFLAPHFTLILESILIECLKLLASIPRSKIKLASIDFDKIAYHKV
jgi:hypothetical protein